jgi:hypothetical protein
MLLEDIHEADFLTIGHMTVDRTFDYSEPAALIFAASDSFKRPVAAVFVAPDEDRLVHFPVTGANKLAWQQARYIDSPNPDLHLQSSAGPNFQPDTKIPNLGELAEPQLGSWLRLVATYWSRPPAARPTPTTFDPA